MTMDTDRLNRAIMQINQAISFIYDKDEPKAQQVLRHAKLSVDAELDKTPDAPTPAPEELPMVDLTPCAGDCGLQFPKAGLSEDGMCGKCATKKEAPTDES